MWVYHNIFIHIHRQSAPDDDMEHRRRGVELNQNSVCRYWFTKLYVIGRLIIPRLFIYRPAVSVENSVVSYTLWHHALRMSHLDGLHRVVKVSVEEKNQP